VGECDFVYFGRGAGGGRIARACSWVYGCDSVVGNVAEWRNK